MRQFGARGAIASIVLTVVVFGTAIGVNTFFGPAWVENGGVSDAADADDLVEQLMISLLVGGGLALAASAVAMRFLRGSDDEPIDYDRL